MREFHFLHDTLDKGIELAPFLIIRRADIIDAVIEQKIGNLVLFALGVEPDRNPALLFHESHTRDIRHTVAEVNHILVIDDAVGHFLVDPLVVRFVVNAFGNTENILRFLGVIDGDFRPNGIFILSGVVGVDISPM